MAKSWLQRLGGFTWLFALMAGCLITPGCGSGGSNLDIPTAAANLVAGGDRQVADADFDGVPDEVEKILGTDPNNIDTDGDGLTDQYEIWGVNGIPVGQMGSLDNLPDLDGDGLIAPLDRKEAGKLLLKNVSALDDDRMRVVDPATGTVPNDQDGDGIPSDYELHGFYYEIDQVTGEDWFVKWDGDWTKPYYKTDPTQWSTDGDPWSDWEEVTKRNMDQRVKHPGDHPCIPAYPDIQAAITSYSIDLNQDTEIESSSGGSASDSWSVNNLTDGWEKQYDNSIDIGGFFEIKNEAGIVGLDASVPPGVITKAEVTHQEGISFGYHHDVTDVSYAANQNYTDTSSGMTAAEWGTATTTSGNSLEAARLILNIKLVNVGTLPAYHPRITFNLKIGTYITHQFLVEIPGTLEARALNTIDFVVATDGYATSAHPGGEALMLSTIQLRSIQSGAPLVLEAQSFNADTLVGVLDPSTGRRAYVTTGSWSPYQAALENVTAKVALDFNEDPILSQPMFSGLAAKKVSDLRVFAYKDNGTYVGSPPTVTIGEALIWAFGLKLDQGNYVVSIYDPISGFTYQSYLANWEFNVDQQVFNWVMNENPQYFVNILALPLWPGNPIEHTYVAKAPPSGLRAKPRIYWASVNPATRKIRAYAHDVVGIKEVRFKPDDQYEGELMHIARDPNDPNALFAHTYDIPHQYRWTGKEKVVAENALGLKTELPIEFVSNELGHAVKTKTTSLGWVPTGASDETNPSVGFNFDADNETFEPFDVQLHQWRVGTGPLQAELIPLNGASVYDMGLVADLNEVDYNYLRKRPYVETTLPVPLDDPLFPAGTPLYFHVFAVRTKHGNVCVFAPQLVERTAAENYVGSVYWQLYEGL